MSVHFYSTQIGVSYVISIAADCTSALFLKSVPVLAPSSSETKAAEGT